MNNLSKASQERKNSICSSQARLLPCIHNNQCPLHKEFLGCHWRKQGGGGLASVAGIPGGHRTRRPGAACSRQGLRPAIANGTVEM